MNKNALIDYIRNGEIDLFFGSLGNCRINKQYQLPLVLFESSYSFLKKQELTTNNENYRLELAKITRGILSIVSEGDFIDSDENTPEFFKILKSIRFERAYTEYLNIISSKFNSTSDENEKERTLKQVVEVYFLIRERTHNKSAISFIEKFDNQIQDKTLIDSFTEINIYELLIDLLKSGIPEVPHFYGLTDLVTPDELFENIGLLVFLKALSLGYGVNTIKYIEDVFDRHQLDFYPLYYLLGQYYRKENSHTNARAFFQKGIDLIGSLTYHSLYDLLVLSESYRGISAVKRKQYKTVMAQYFTEICDGFSNAQNILEKLKDSSMSKMSNIEKLTFNKVYSDILFSFGYFEFESFFSNKGNYKEIDLKTATSILNKFSESYKYNPHFTAPNSRAAIIQLYCNRIEDSFEKFYSVYIDDLRYLKTKPDHERSFTLIWVSFAIYILSRLENSRSTIKIEYEDVLNNLQAAFKRPSPIGTVECHLFDTYVLYKILESRELLTDDSRSEIEGLLNKFEEEYQKVKKK